MVLLRAAEVRAMSADERRSRLKDLQQDLMHERGVAAMGGSPPSPGKIRQIRTAIARIHTIQRLDELNRVQFTRKEIASGAAAARAAPAATKPRTPSSKAPPKAAARPTEGKPARAKPMPRKATGGKTGGHG